MDVINVNCVRCVQGPQVVSAPSASIVIMEWQAVRRLANLERINLPVRNVLVYVPKYIFNKVFQIVKGDNFSLPDCSCHTHYCSP